jgi:integrase
MLGDFLNHYRAKTTRAMYVSAWVKFLSLVYSARLKGASPEILDPWVAKYVNDLRNGRRDLSADLRALGEGCRTPKTGEGYQSAIRTLIGRVDSSLLPERGVRARRDYRQPRPPTGEETLSPTRILKLMEHLDTRGRAILYVLASSGARLGEALSIRLGDLDLDSRPAGFRIRNANGEVSRMAFLSREAVGAIRVYLIVRDRYLASARSRGGKGAGDLLFPLGTRTFEQIWSLALSKARLERFDPATGRRTIPPRATRRFFAERMRTVVPLPAVAAMLGHASRIPGTSYRYTDEELARAFLEGERAVTLHRSHRRERMARKIAELERLLLLLQEKVGGGAGDPRTGRASPEGRGQEGNRENG